MNVSNRKFRLFVEFLILLASSGIILTAITNSSGTDRNILYLVLGLIIFLGSFMRVYKILKASK